MTSQAQLARIKELEGDMNTINPDGTAFNGHVGSPILASGMIAGALLICLAYLIAIILGWA